MKMIAVIKIKLTYNSTTRPSENADVVWVYESFDAARKKIFTLDIRTIDSLGYQNIRSGKKGNQYAIDLLFKGTKDSNYLEIEKAIRPLVRERQLNQLLGN
jgi:hypothetical protein